MVRVLKSPLQCSPQLFPLSLRLSVKMFDSCDVQADQICYAVLCVFSYVAAGQQQKTGGRKQGHTVTSGSVSPRGPRYSHPPQKQ